MYSKKLNSSCTTKGPKKFVNSLTVNELKSVQSSWGLVNSINVDSLSSEGAKNLLSQPDRSTLVDPNNDGIIEIGESQSIQFPSVNSPQRVKDAWEAATKDMDSRDKMILELTMHHAVYGISADIPGVSKPEPLAPEVQWSDQGIKQLIEHLRSGLEFAIAMDGETKFNKASGEFYDRFEAELT